MKLIIFFVCWFNCVAVCKTEGEIQCNGTYKQLSGSLTGLVDMYEAGIDFTVMQYPLHAYYDMLTKGMVNLDICTQFSQPERPLKEDTTMLNLLHGSQTARMCRNRCISWLSVGAVVCGPRRPPIRFFSGLVKPADQTYKIDCAQVPLPFDQAGISNDTELFVQFRAAELHQPEEFVQALAKYRITTIFNAFTTSATEETQDDVDAAIERTYTAIKPGHLKSVTFSGVWNALKLSMRVFELLAPFELEHLAMADFVIDADGHSLAPIGSAKLLRLNFYKMTSVKNLTPLLEKSPNLEVLYINRCDWLSVDGPEYSNLKQLRIVVITYNKKFDVSNTKLFPNSEKLEVLEMTQTKISTIYRENFIHMKNLKALHLSGNFITALAAEHFEGLSNLMLLDISQPEKARPMFVQSLFGFSGRWMPVDFTKYPSQLQPIPQDLFKYTPNLKILYLTNNDDLRIDPLALSNLRLRKLDLERCSHIANDFVDMKLDMKLCSLEKVWLNRVNLTSGPNWLTFDLVANMPRLQRMEIFKTGWNQYTAPMHLLIHSRSSPFLVGLLKALILTEGGFDECDKLYFQHHQYRVDQMQKMKNISGCVQKYESFLAEIDEWMPSKLTSLSMHKCGVSATRANPATSSNASTFVANIITLFLSLIILY